MRGSVKLLPKNVKRPGTEPHKVRFVDQVIDASRHFSMLTQASARQQWAERQATGSGSGYIALTAGPVRHQSE